MGDPRESSSFSVKPRIRYNTIGGVNGPLVILENVCSNLRLSIVFRSLGELRGNEVREEERANVLPRSNFLDTTRSSP
jgi:hypothetical protein